MTSEAQIILVRHGETEANRIHCFAASDEIPLTETGRLQAREVAGVIAREHQPEMILSSEFLRARQTAEIIAEALGLPTATLPGIHERDFGCLRGLPYGEMGRLMDADSAYDPARPWTWAPSGGESLDDVRRRAVAALDAARMLYPGMRLVIVAHGAVIQSVAAELTGSWSEASLPANCGILPFTRPFTRPQPS